MTIDTSTAPALRGDEHEFDLDITIIETDAGCGSSFNQRDLRPGCRQK